MKVKLERDRYEQQRRSIGGNAPLQSIAERSFESSHESLLIQSLIQSTGVKSPSELSDSFRKSDQNRKMRGSQNADPKTKATPDETLELSDMELDVLLQTNSCKRSHTLK